VKRLILASRCLSVTLVVGAAAAGGLLPEDLQRLHDYALSMDKVKAMQAAVDEAKPTQQKMTEQGRGIDRNAHSLTEMEANLKAIPPLYVAYTRHGLTAEDAVLMLFVLMDAGMVAAYPSAAAKFATRTSPAQIAFYKEHEQELKAMPWLYGDSPKGD